MSIYEQMSPRMIFFSSDGSPKLSRTAPIPIRSTKQSAYMDMGPSSQPLAPVKEGGSKSNSLGIYHKAISLYNVNFEMKEIEAW